MRLPKWESLLGLGLVLGVLLACSATTANISSLKVATDKEGKNETKNPQLVAASLTIAAIRAC